MAGFEPTVWRTTNGGGLWTKVYEGTPSDVVHDLHVVDPADTTLLAAFTEGGAGVGVLRSTTGGASWVPSSTGLSPTAQCNSLSASPMDPGEIYVSNSESVSKPGVYRSTMVPKDLLLGMKDSNLQLADSKSATLPIELIPNELDRLYIQLLLSNKDFS